MSPVETEVVTLEAQIGLLQDQLQEATDTLDAIRNGDVDAVVIGGPAGQVVYTLENADKPYRVLVEQMREGAVTLDAAGTILYSNYSFAELVKEKQEAVVGERIFDFVAEPTALNAMFAAATPSGAAIELTLLTTLGDAIAAHISVVELKVEDEAPRMLCMIVTDLRQNYERAREVSEANQRLAAEIAERTRAEESLAFALDAAGMGSWDLDLQSREATRSPRHDAIFGYVPPRPRWGLADTVEHFMPEDRDAAVEAFRAAEISGELDLECRIRRGDGAVRWVHLQGRAFYRDRKPDRFAGIIVDTTERRLIDAQLRQGQKMEAIGQLTGGIAHDFNNLLMIIGGSLESLARRAELDPRAQKLLDAARLGVARGAKLNEQLLAFARRQDMHEDVVQLTELLPNFETLLDRALGEAVQVEVNKAEDLWWCRTDAHQLETAILNLAINARDAMNGSGRLTLTTVNATVGKTEADRLDAAPGDYVVAAVADTGCGLSPEVAARVFEPFFTTKEIGKGTGLGLSQVYGFARQSGGFVTIDSEVGRGATVSIYLPRADALREDRVAPQATPIRLDRAGGAVLLVEDDGDVRAATNAMLEELGHTVIAAASGEEALEILSGDAHVDLMFSDVILASGMTGIDLAQITRGRRPELPILLTSGYTAQRVIPAALTGDLPLLRKPYTLAQMAEAVDQLIIARSSSTPKPRI